MGNYNFEEKQLNEFLEKNDLKSAKEYLIITKNFTTEEAISFLHLYINKNNISIKKAKDINYGYKNILLISIGLIAFSIILFLLSFGVIRNIIDSSSKSSKIIFLIVLFISLISSIGYLIVLILDLFSKKIISVSGYYSISALKSSSYKNLVLKFQTGESIIISGKINEVLKNYNYCTIERFRYSKLIKSIIDIK